MTTSAAAHDPAAGDGAASEPVLIVGAGPVGLVVACELLRRGVCVRVVDRSPGVQDEQASKAILVWPRTLELVHGLGIAGQMVREGHLLGGVRFYSDGSPLGEVDLERLPDSAYRHILMLPQWRTTRILRERFAQLGGAIEWGAEVVRVAEEPGRAVAVLRRAGQEDEVVYAPWLVGADGAHSTVRKQTGVPFTITSPNTVFAIGDCPVDGSLGEEVLHYFYSRNGAMGVGPLGGRVFRFAVNIAEGEKPERELFQAALDKRTGRADAVGKVGEPVWTAVFTVRCATAERFRSGRVFLVGDAAHVLSPAGGQGLNTGIQDAVNLGWKLAGVRLGRLRPEVLDSYDAERREAVAQVSGSTAMQTRWGLIRTQPKMALRDLIVRVSAATGLMQRVLAPLFSQTDLFYGPRGTAFTLGPGLGRMWRYPRLAVGGRLPHLAQLAGCAGGPDGVLPTLVLSRGRADEEQWSAIVARLLEQAPARLQVIELNGATEHLEAAARLGRMLGPKPTALLVRPDGHVGAIAPAADPDLVYAPLRELLAAPAPLAVRT